MTTGSVYITPAQLRAALQAVDPAVRLVAPGVLRRVIRRHRRMSGLALGIPHADGYWLDTDALGELVTEEDLGAPPPTGPVSLLIAQPDEDDLGERPAAEVLRERWRVLFHLCLHRELDRLHRDGALTPAVVRARIQRIGQTEFDEVRAVLRAQRRLLPPLPGESRDLTALVEFTATFLELRWFEPAAVAPCFPALARRQDGIEALLGSGLDVEPLLARTRPASSAEAVLPDDPGDGEEVEPVSGSKEARGGLAAGTSRRLLRKARRARAVGNDVQAARLALRAAGGAEPATATGVAHEALASLSARLATLADEGIPAADWEEALDPLLRRTAAGYARAEARLLYDLQKACLEAAQTPYRIDLVEWILSLGRRPVRRPLEHVPVVRAHRHARSARRRLANTHLSDGDRGRLGELLQRTVHGLEHRLRERLRPALDEAIRRAGLDARGVVEQVARDRMAEELLDRLVERGFFSLSELRDAIARSSAKLEDLGGPGELLRGDALLRLDRCLAAPFEGVYRRGEIYLRGLQRASSVVFGTGVGRFLTRYVLLPAGGAYVALEGLQHIVGPLVARLAGRTPHLSSLPALVTLALCLLAVINFTVVRQGVVSAARGLWRGIAWLVSGLPRAVLALPAMRAVLESRPWRWLTRFGVKPGLPAAALAGGLRATVVTSWAWWVFPAALYLGLMLLANTGVGLRLEERIGDWLLRGWRRLRHQLLPGLVRWILWVFEWLLVLVERLLYRVDEWLRFRPGESRLGLIAKPVLGLLWFGATYLIRIYVNLLVEPQVNPVKHFPVVTVSHKIILPMSFTLTEILRAPLMPLGSVVANTVAVATVFLLPGVFGFLVWELKANWRLYRANRPPALGPVPVGSHGETVARLLRPGFHSGTLPRLFARLRRARRRGELRGRWRSSLRIEEGLHHVDEAVRRFVERDLLALVNGSRAWRERAVRDGAVWLRGARLTSNRIVVELTTDQGPDAPALCEIAFDEHAGVLVAGVQEHDGLSRLDGERRAVLAAGLVGLYKRAGVDLVRQQLEVLLPVDTPYHVIGDTLVVWPDGFGNEVVYRLGDRATFRPEVGEVGKSSEPSPALPALARTDLLLSEHPVAFERWAAAWDTFSTSEQPRPLAGQRVLP